MWPNNSLSNSVSTIAEQLHAMNLRSRLVPSLWIARTPLGKQVQLKIQREQREMDLNLTVAELPQGPMQKKDIG